MSLMIRVRGNLLRDFSRRNRIAARKCSTRQPWQWPKKEGLYDPKFEKEGCGVGMLVSINGETSSKIMTLGRRLSLSMIHRGAQFYDNVTGDGAGVLTSIPHKFYANILKSKHDVVLPPPHNYATGLVFLDNNNFKESEEKFAELAESLDLSVIAWRKVPVDNGVIGELARYGEPLIKQVFVVAKSNIPVAERECKYYILRKRAAHTIQASNRRFYICSLSSRTIVYKAHATAKQLWLYYPDLLDPHYLTNVVLVHNRFSTNTLPSWELAHPFRIICHNGEINTLRGNINWMTARETMMESDILEDQLNKIYPVIEANNSDSGSLDCMIEFLMHAGKRSLPEAVMTLIPEAWHQDPTMSEEKKIFYKWAACAMEPWDGPALIAFTDGRYAGAVQDRNGLRPSRFYVTKDNLLVMASEIDMYDIDDPCNIILKSRLKPGRMLLIDMDSKKLIRDEELKKAISESRPHGVWLKEQLLTMDDFRKADIEAGGNLRAEIKPLSLTDKRLALFNYVPQLINIQLLHMFRNKREAQTSMGKDTPLACLSQHAPLLYDYFKQGLAQVTNPPVDLDRENLVMSLECPIGPTANLLLPSAEQAHRLWLENPILSIQDMEVLKRTTHRNWTSKVVNTTYSKSEGLGGLKFHIDRICKEVEQASRSNQFVILSDRKAGEKCMPIRSLLVLGAVHQHLLNMRTRMKVAIIVETAEVKLVHEIAVLLGYGADAICPYLALELGAGLRKEGILEPEFTDEIIFNNYSEALSQGLLTVMARAGITTLQSYKNAQIFEAIGIGDDIIEKCFKGTPSRIGGLTMNMLACAKLERHVNTYKQPSEQYVTTDSGMYHYRAGGEKHMNSPEAVAFLQEAAQLHNIPAYRKFRKIDEENRKECLLRGQLGLNTIKIPVPFGEIESAEDIVKKRFSIGGINLGSINNLCHETIARAMNKVGARMKQLSSARWGVTSAYLAHAQDIEIKVAQGAKPGEGGLLSAEKNTPALAKVRRTPAGVKLIGPPPHHDIYSIEDLSQLIYELNSANPQARISVKIAAVAGSGIIATGAVKCKARHIVICGHDGGTGAANWTSINHSAIPWELGISETHQVLTRNRLRKQVTLQVDGQIRTGFDVVVAALLGADEVALGTSALIALGCVMTRKCHLNTCPVGIATMNPELMQFFQGKPEHLIDYLTMLAHDVRYHMASIGMRNFDDMIGRTDLLRVLEPKGYREKMLDFSNILHKVTVTAPEVKAVTIHKTAAHTMDDDLIKVAMDVIEGKKKVVNIEKQITNQNRALGAKLSYHISKKYGEAGLPEDSHININLSGTAGQSFCVFLAKGITCTLEGDANDYVGKGLSGGTVIIYPPKEAVFESHLNVIAGNVCLYGATSGKMFLRGIAGERFAVRNSGVTAVVEGVGDHCCELMTAGTIVVLGLTGRNFGTGMMGGVAYVWDIDKNLHGRCRVSDVGLLKLENPEEIEKIKNLLYEFLHATKSLIAEQLLKNFNQKVGEFVKIIPRYQYDQLKQTISADKSKKEEQFDPKYAFLKYPREMKILRPIEERVKDFKEIYNFDQIYKSAPKEASRCIDCAVPFCQTSNYGCPLENLIPNWTSLVGENRWHQAALNLMRTNNFPEFTARVCPAPCEHACVLSLSMPAVAIRNIECAIIDKAFEKGWVQAEIPQGRTDKKAAIIGSGPAGLTCAAQLNKAGHRVTVFERNKQIGGLLYYGISSAKLDKQLIKRRLKLLEKEGIKFKTEMHVGKDISVEELEREYDAIVLCLGATLPYDLQIPGRNLKGVYLALDFLRHCCEVRHSVRGSCAELKDKSVVIIGGGPTAVDCLTTIIRYGIKSVKILSINSQPPNKRSLDNRWPNPPDIKKIMPAHESTKHIYGSDNRMYNVETISFEGDRNDQVTAVKMIKIEWVNVNGRFKAQHIAGTEQTLPADCVIIATGFRGPEKHLIDECRLEYENKHNIKTKNHGTNEEFIFAAGDCRMGETLVATAMADGREAARNVDTFLTGKPSTLPTASGFVPTSVDCSTATEE
ncbi:fad nadph dehydrogenase/oxidoreductase [Holotrichia oblita]|uniref:Fad nadph dehydrogenase/oxidoreductase n=1 Tax=Holotrichia oblita TaxID=644536 RepID=A0ACB9SSQ8_HOLOL|nr:fad nadph dehydrogenase/oxidoreductase [Holotrichia oblita]